MIVVEEMVQKYDRIEKSEMHWGKFFLTLLISVLIAIGLVFFVNWLFLRIKKSLKHSQEKKGILVVKGTKLKLKR